MKSNGDGTVTHSSEGIYLSKFMAGVVATILAAAIIGTFTNLWYLNAKTIEFETFKTNLQLEGAVLPGALPRSEWELEKRIILGELQAINRKLDEMR